MEFKVDELNHIKIQPKRGCKVVQLTLGGKTIVTGNTQDENYLGSGSYLMFPWVNRITQNPYLKIVENPFKDGKGYPLHGLFAKTQRLIQCKKTQQQVQITIKNAQSKPQIHNFYQTYTLSKNILQIQINVLPSQQDKNPFCFGYHPYFKLSKPISQLNIQTNLSKQIKLQEDLLVSFPLKFQNWQGNGKIDGTKKYDSLFMSDNQFTEEKLSTWVRLSDGINNVKIQSNLQYWQIYTPEDGMRMAIQPMSFYGNVYQAAKLDNQLIQKLPKSGKIRISIQ